MTRILVVDNYDSFVYTIVGYLEHLGAELVVKRNDEIQPQIIDERIVDDHGIPVDGVLISPGPGTPSNAGVSQDMIRACARTSTPMLGVCLGHQALAEVYGATVSHAPELMHGKTSQVDHDHRGVFHGMPQPFTATRYHSLAVVPDTIPEALVVTARTSTGIIMGLQHRTLPLHGVQFHPESVLTERGYHLFATWLAECGLCDAVERSAGLNPLVQLG